MMRNVKTLGLAIVAAMALSAAMASAAAADNFASRDGNFPLNLHGVQENHIETGTGSSVADKFKTQGGTLQCASITYTGTMAATGTTVTTTPTYLNCTYGGFTATVDMNGCDYLFHVNAAAGVTTGTVDIVCSGANEITITVLPGVTPRCIGHVPPQSGKGTITYSNFKGPTATEDEVKFSIDIQNIAYSQTAGTGVGKCAAASTGAGIYEGAAKMAATRESNGAREGIFLE